MIARQWAEVQAGSSGSSYGDREYGERWSREQRRTPKPESGYLDHYAEKAAAREAAQREAEEYGRAVENSRQWRERYEAGEEWQKDNPRPRAATPDQDDFLERMAEVSAWEKAREKYLARVEGEKLAARIFRH
ncbi:hypothetical protein ACPCSC_08270 [Streptomyces lavendulocolor]|uniref:hypothetical protein n=1 Tax=Streptomyces lavendulocolor TaxID=67316 RepID=UPI003C2CF0B9